MSRICSLGVGAWGITLADLLAEKGNEVKAWDVNTDALAQMQQTRSHPKLQGLRIHANVSFEPDFAKAVDGSEYIVCAVASHAVRTVCGRLKDMDLLGNRIFVCCSKGIEEGTLMLGSDIFVDVFGRDRASQFVALAGPSHAEEVCRRIPTVVTSCSESLENAEAVRDLFMLPMFRIYTQSDCRGVELGGALKNVIAIAAGISDGLGFGDNTKAALVTRGLAEIARAACAMGAQAQTLSGLAGLGDLIVTAMSRHSRNRAFGELLGSGHSPAESLEKVGAVVEGYRTSRSAKQLAAKTGVEMPICEAVYAVVHENLDIRTAIEGLIQRLPKPEIY